MTSDAPDAGAPVYLLVAARAYSGSTLLASLLGAHPRMATVSEVSGSRRQHQMDTFACSCGRLMADCPFWDSVRAGMRSRGHADFALGNFGLNFSRADSGLVERLRTGSLRWTALEDARDAVLRRVPGYEREMAAIGRRSGAFAETVNQLSGADVFVDASKERMRARYLARYLPMELRVVHLVRDPRGVVDSMARHAGRAIDFQAAAREWAGTNQTIARHAGALPEERRLLLRYEDLCADPAGALEAVARFAGVPATDGTGWLAADPPEQHLLGNARRLEAGWAAIAADERWRTNLDAAQQRLVAVGAGAAGRRWYPDLAGSPAAAGTVTS